MESDPFSAKVILSNLNITFLTEYTSLIAGLVVLVILLFFSAMISGSEVAYFSLKPTDVDRFKKEGTRKSKLVIGLLENPQQLLATILVSNNFINIGIVILSTYLSFQLVGDSLSPLFTFLLEVVGITFLLLLFGEIIPKVYANQFAVGFSKAMAYPLRFLNGFFKPISILLINSSSLVDRKVQKKSNLSIGDLSDALEITSDTIADDKDILKGIVEFGNIEVSEIMCPRVDVLAFDKNTPFTHIVSAIHNAGYSRIPVYNETFDEITGILYIKDLLPHLNKEADFNWQDLVREPYFVPEKKKINELLKELQLQKIHMAIVVDEYGGTSGIITMEDIIEEIIGDITDEFDDEDIPYVKINDKNYLLDGKILLNDLSKVLEIDSDFFDEVRGEAETLAGLILEMKGEFPKVYDVIKYKHFTFTIDKVDNRRIIKIKLTIS